MYLKKIIRRVLMEEINLLSDKDKSSKDNIDLCDELTVSSLAELRSKMRGMKISKKDRKEVNRLLSDMKKELKDLDSDLEVLDTYLHKIQYVISTDSKEDINNID